MQQQMRKITSSLAGEIVCFRELLKVAERERDILLKGSHHELIDTAQLKLELGRRLSEMQQDRRRLMEELAPESGRPLRLRDLAGFLPPEEQAPYRAALGEAQSLAERLSQMSQVSKHYVEEALDTVDHLLGILSGRGAAQGYSPHGRPQAASRPRILTRSI